MNNKEIAINIYVESFKKFCPLTRNNHNYDFGLSGKYMLLGSVLSQQRFGVTDIKAFGGSQLLSLGQTVL